LNAIDGPSDAPTTQPLSIFTRGGGVESAGAAGGVVAAGGAAARGVSIDDYFRANLLGREVAARDVADAFAYLATAPSTTGCVVTVDGGNAAAFTADVSRAGDVEAMVAAGLKAFGRIDVLDNNVGIAEMGNVVEVSEADWDRVFAVNLKSAFLAMKHVIPVMERQGGGSIINISSIASIRHLGISYVTYATTKAAMNQMTRTTAVEFAPNNIRVNAILPGLMKTPMVEHSAGLFRVLAQDALRTRGGGVRESAGWCACEWLEWTVVHPVPGT